MTALNPAAEVANREANEAFAAGDVAKAIEGYSKAIGIDAKTAKYFGNRANAYLTNKRFAKAAHDADKAIELEPTSGKFYYRAAVAYLETGDIIKAQERVESWLAVDPASSDAAKLRDDVAARLLERADPETAAGAKIAGLLFLQNADKDPQVYRLPSGLRFRIKKKHETGVRSPTISDDCDVHYHGTLVNEKVFDSSYQRGTPATFAPNQVIAGWTEALQLMGEGETWEVYLPYELAYGTSGVGSDIPGFSTLIFTIELIKVHGSGGVDVASAQSRLEALLGGKRYESLAES